MSKEGSLENMKEMTQPHYKFQEKEIPKGSPAFQLVITDVEAERCQSDSDEADSIRRPSAEYMGRRRNTVACAYGAGGRRTSNVHFNLELEIVKHRKNSLMPGLSRSRSPSPMRGQSINKNRTRTLSPCVDNRHHNGQSDLAFGSTKERDCILR